ncbi:hypothetical protein BBJ28_00026959 [Nothophytophthora sp. Chile5]|nr:hypothetical protein BBJ28_00026959 [Nothophytophthora sp. Chile5]
MQRRRFHDPSFFGQRSDARMLELEDENYRLAPLRDPASGGFLRRQYCEPQTLPVQRGPAQRQRWAPQTDVKALEASPYWIRDQDAPEEETEEDEETTTIAKKSKSNSERGKEFRARRKNYESQLQTLVGALRQEVADLGFLRGVRADNAFSSRNSMGGSLVRLARQYFAMFERGMPTLRSSGQKRPALLTAYTAQDQSLEAKQEEFLKCAMDPDLQFGGVQGYQALLDQWKRYTSYHSSLSVEVVGIEVSGPEDNPLVTVRSDLHVRFSRATFENVFPHAAHLEDLVQRYIGREVTYRGVNRFQFSPEGQILIYDSDVGFVDALVRAGASLSDLAILMQQAKIAQQCRIGEEDDGPDDSNNNEASEPQEEDSRDFTQVGDDGNDASDGFTDADSDAGGSAPSEPEGGCGYDTDEAGPAERSRLAIDFLLS